MTVESLPQSVVLVADDTPTSLQMIGHCLEDHGIRVLVAQDGEEVVQRACVALPNLILMDVLMPRVDGLEACRRIKADARTKDIPVLFMTCVADTQYKVKAFRAGGVDYLTKPVHVEELLARVGTHLCLRALREELRKQNDELQVEIEARARTEVELRQALKDVRVLRGMLPICAWCKCIRDDTGYWAKLEQYLSTHTEVVFTHALCPQCAEKLKAQANAARQPDSGR